MQTYSSCKILNVLTTALHGSIHKVPNIHHLWLGLLGVSKTTCSPSFHLSVLVSAQQSTFIIGVLLDLYAFRSQLKIPYTSTILKHHSFYCLSEIELWDLMTNIEKTPTNVLFPIILDNTCILCLTTYANTELADTYSSDTIIASSLRRSL